MGAAMDTSGFLADPRSTAATGAWFSAHHHGVGLPGSTMAIMAPSGGPQKPAGLQGESRRIRVRALWGSNGLVCLWGSNGLDCLSLERNPGLR